MTEIKRPDWCKVYGSPEHEPTYLNRLVTVTVHSLQLAGRALARANRANSPLIPCDEAESEISAVLEGVSSMPLNDGRNKPIDGYGGGSSGGGSSGSSGGRVNLTVGLPVAGYQPQSQIAIDWVNENKRLEEQVLRRLDKLFVAEASDVLVDRRWLEIAKTHIEEGFMAMNRGIFCPQRLKDDQL